MVVVALDVWMKEKASRSSRSFYSSLGAVLVVASKFPNGSCGSAPTVNMTNTFRKKKKRKE